MSSLGTKIVIENFGIWMDGGSIILQCSNEAGEELELYFMQHSSWTYYEFMKIPGRVYLNGVLVDQRSALEAAIITELTKATYKNTDPQVAQLLNDRLKYVASEQYLKDPEQLVMLKVDDQTKH